jgi:hypothetical protein
VLKSRDLCGAGSFLVGQDSQHGSVPLKPKEGLNGPPAKVAAARKLAVRLYWMLRTQKPYPEIVRIESSPRVPLVGAS